MNRICCKCGALYAIDAPTICKGIEGSEHHCYCCAQPPLMKCINCNMWRDLYPSESHGACIGDGLHVFVYSEPWPPFPEHTPLSPLRAIPVTNDTEQFTNVRRKLHSSFEPNGSSPLYSIDLSGDDVEEPQEMEETVDTEVKPKLYGKPQWVTIADVHRWSQCYRCGLERINKRGWLRHVQMCAQDDKYSTRKFFIHLHTLAWCGVLVRDVFWENHSNPENGKCEICRNSRISNIPLPHQPKAPPRKNGVELERRRRNRMIISRKKRRQTITVEAISNSTGRSNSVQVVECSSQQ